MAVLLVIIFPELSNAQNTREIEVSLSSDDFTLVRDDSITDINMNPELNCFFLGIRAPRIPYFTKNILLPKNSTKASATFVSNNETVYDDIELRILEPFIPGYNLNVNNVEGTTFATFPDSQIENVKLFDFEGYKVATILYTPYHYDVISKRLIVYNDIVLTLSTETERSLSTIQYSEKDREYVKSMVINNEEIDILYPLDNTRQTTNTVGGLEDISDKLYYLVITSSSLESSFDSLVLLKDYKGKTARVVTTDSIYSLYSTGTNAQKIRNFIKLQKTNHSELEYVLLGGDYSVIPAVKIQLPNSSNSPVNVPSDMFYASLNYNFTSINPTINIFGVPSSNVTLNLKPNVIVSRLPFNNVEDITRYVSKLWKHETYSMDNLPVRDFLFAGAETSFTLINSGISDAHNRGNELKSKYLLRDSTFKCNTLFDTGSDFINAPYTLDSTMLNQAMSEGTHIMHMDSHGNSYEWSLSGISSSNVYNVNNTIGLYQNSPSVVFTSACDVNNFSVPNFLGEGFLKRGANTIGFLGCSNTSIGTANAQISGNYAIECSTKIIDRYLDFELGTLSYASLGEGYKEMKNDYVRQVSNSNTDSYFWMFFSYNMLGDPNAKLYTRKPIDTGKPRTYATKDKFYIDNDTLWFFTVIENEEDSMIIYKPISLNYGKIDFNNEQDGFIIVYFNGKSYLQFIDPLFDTDLYLYGTFNNSRTYKFRNINIGMDVSNHPTQNLRLRPSADLKLYYSGELSINGTFNCEQGAELLIQPSDE